MAERKWLNDDAKTVKIEHEEDVSESLRGPLYSTLIAVPLCNACKKWHPGTNVCEKYERIPPELRACHDYDCDFVDLDETSWIYPEVLTSLQKWKNGELDGVI